MRSGAGAERSLGFTKGGAATTRVFKSTCGDTCLFISIDQPCGRQKCCMSLEDPAKVTRRIRRSLFVWFGPFRVGSCTGAHRLGFLSIEGFRGRRAPSWGSDGLGSCWLIVASCYYSSDGLQLNSSFLLLVVMPGATSSFLLLVVVLSTSTIVISRI